MKHQVRDLTTGYSQLLLWLVLILVIKLQLMSGYVMLCIHLFDVCYEQIRLLVLSD